jgi:type II secretion system protein N
MKLPSLRLSVSRASFEWMDDIDVRRLLLYGLYTLALFAVFLVVNFPHKIFVERALSGLDLGTLRLDVRGTRFAWWNGWELQSVALRQAGRQDRLLESQSLYVRPSLKGLSAGRLDTVDLTGVAYGGTLSGNWSSAAGATRAALRFTGLQLGRYMPITTLLEEGQITGLLSGAVTFENRRGDNRTGRGAGEIELRDGNLVSARVQGFSVPDLHFTTVTMKFSMQGRDLEIEELQADGNELKITAAGQVAVRDPLGDSVLNLRVKALPGPNSPDTVRALLTLVPQPPKGRPDAPFSVSGTLSKPRLR